MLYTQEGSKSSLYNQIMASYDSQSGSGKLHLRHKKRRLRTKKRKRKKSKKKSRFHIDLILLPRTQELPCHSLGAMGLVQQVLRHRRVGEQDLFYDPQPFASSFKLLMFFAASNGQVRTRTVRQSARGGGTPCPALIDYRWCGSARNCKAGYFKW